MLYNDEPLQKQVDITVCAICKTEETQIFESGVTICCICATLREARAKDALRHSGRVHSSLVEGLIKALKQAGLANAALAEVSDSRASHDVRRIQRASLELSAASKDVTDSNSRINNFLTHGIIPDDLKPAWKLKP